MKEGGTFFAIALFLLVLFYGYIESQGGMKGSTNLAIAQPSGPTDYHAMARQDAVNNGLDPDKFERQINQESGFNPSAVSSAGAIGISQFMPDTARGLGIDPWNAEQALQGAAHLMASYNAKYGDYSKALSAYNYGSTGTDSAISRCGWNWKTCVPAETQNYIKVIVG
jgi:soluble lytic murein transglycosylase-like protein